MMFFRKLKLLIAGLLITVSSLEVCGQDLLARQAPLDRKMRAIDSVALQQQISIEQAEHPAFSLYPSWNNERVHVYADVVLPDTFRIDLRGFSMPTPSQKITSRFGYRRRFRRQHKGLDVKVYTGDTIYAAFSGKIRIVDYERKGYGNYVVIRHENGLETIYGHLSKHLVKENQYVRSGEPIGLGGNTGKSFGSHLHFETRFLGQEINPELLFDFPNQDVTGDFYTFYSPRNKRKSALAQGHTSKSEARYYRIRQGDNLSKISKKYGVSIEQLCRLNGINRRTILRQGQLLRY